MNNAALFNQALALHRAGRREEAEKLYLDAVRAAPSDFAARCMLGVLHLEQGRAEEAAQALAEAIKLDPRPVQGHANYALALMRLERFAEAEAAFADALARSPGNVDLLVNRGAALTKLYRFEEAIACYDQALARRPDLAEAHYNKANAYQTIGRWQDAAESYDRALAIKPDYAAAHRNRAVSLMRLKRYAEAATAFAASLESAPDHADAIVGLAQAAAHACDWRERDKHKQALLALIDAGTSVSPLTLLVHFDDPALHLKNARLIAQRIAAQAPSALPRSGKIRLAYLSCDFRDHPVARIAVDLFERHDRGAFNVIGISLGGDDGSPLRARCVAAFDEFHDMRFKSDDEIAGLIREKRVDILVDLGGYTADARPGVLARRAAPTQVNWLGYPGTLGADFVDYVIADPVVAPPGHEPFFAEKIVRLPCYLPHDSKRPRPRTAPARADVGLPETGLVFCAFNNAFKITPEIFDAWMRLLHAVDGAVLWLAETSDDATENLRERAQARGVDLARLVFAPRVPDDEDHLARYLLADLFLDTAPYNAHSTALDALWMGVPVITILGESFAGRVAASLCESVGAPELVAADLAAYEQTALTLAFDPQRLTALKQRLKAPSPLFDGDVFRRNLEAAYAAMRS